MGYTPEMQVVLTMHEQEPNTGNKNRIISTNPNVKGGLIPGARDELGDGKPHLSI